MKVERFTYQGIDGKNISGMKWHDDKKDGLKGAFQIAHGMAEHIERYDDFARFLVQKGYIVFGNDHRGHGATCGKGDVHGYFDDKKGWEFVVSDMRLLQEYMKKEVNTPNYYLLGHSMGSFLSREFSQIYGDSLQGLILSGTGGPPGVDAKAGLLIAKLQGMIFGKKEKSHLLNKMSFGSFNNDFQPVKTGFDWLSSDSWEVEAYVNDPRCGQVFTIGFFQDLLEALIRINKWENHSRTTKDLPVFLISGDLDPVGKKTLGVKEVKELYVKNGNPVSTRFYSNGRHEMLHEINKEEVYEDIYQWLEKIQNRKRS